MFLKIVVQKQTSPFISVFTVYSLWRYSVVTWKFLVFILVDMDRGDQDLYIGTTFSGGIKGGLWAFAPPPVGDSAPIFHQSEKNAKN